MLQEVYEMHVSNKNTLNNKTIMVYQNNIRKLESKPERIVPSKKVYHQIKKS